MPSASPLPFHKMISKKAPAAEIEKRLRQLIAALQPETEPSAGLMGLVDLVRAGIGAKARVRSRNDAQAAIRDALAHLAGTPYSKAAVVIAERTGARLPLGDLETAFFRAAEAGDEALCLALESFFPGPVRAALLSKGAGLAQIHEHLGLAEMLSARAQALLEGANHSSGTSVDSSSALGAIGSISKAQP